MDKRKLTQEEYQTCLNLYRSLYPNEYKFWAIVFGAISILLFIFFFLAFYYGDGDSLSQSLRKGLYGPGFVIGILIYNLIINRNKFESLNKFKTDLKEKVVVIQTIDVIKVWQVFDPGYNDKPDWLFKTVDDKWLCVANLSIDPITPKSQVLLHKLKHSKTIVKTETAGVSIPVEEKVIEANNEWRNDDLPYETAFKFERLSENLKTQLKS